MIARALALRGLVGVDVDRSIVHLDLHHGVYRISGVALIAGGCRRAGCRTGSARGAWRNSSLPLAARTDLLDRRALVAMAAETDQVAVAREVAVFAVRGDVAVTSAELADWTFVAFCEQIELLARHSCCRAVWEALDNRRAVSDIMRNVSEKCKCKWQRNYRCEGRCDCAFASVRMINCKNIKKYLK